MIGSLTPGRILFDTMRVNRLRLNLGTNSRDRPLEVARESDRMIAISVVIAISVADLTGNRMRDHAYPVLRA